MSKIQVVIGAAYGDEGKGKSVDYLASKLDSDKTIVVRFQGGSQCGHTVVTPEGFRHVFSHFGSATLLGIPTFLSNYVVCNPLVFQKEYQEIKNFNPVVYASSKCFVTTPYDMIINQIVEESRGKNRHGSCGIGFNETIERCIKHPEFATTVDRPFGGKEFPRKILEIRNKYVKNRLKELKIEEINDKWKKIIENESLIYDYKDKISFFRSKINILDSHKIIEETPNIIFEGGQGLMLDEDSYNFPHVTRSKTGLTNVEKILIRSYRENEEVEVFYAMRPYITRHGAGPLLGEIPKLPYRKFEDKTNIYNLHQESLRFAPFNFGLILSEIRKDLNNSKLEISPKIFLNCFDHISENENMITEDGKISKESFLKSLCSNPKEPTIFIGNGETRNDVKIWRGNYDY